MRCAWGFSLSPGLDINFSIVSRTDVKILRYTVTPDNFPSVHVVEKYGFEKVREQMDPENGLELSYEKTSEEFTRRFI